MSEISSDRHSEPDSTAEELERARDELARQLDVACATPVGGVADETTGQLRRLDDALLAAAHTAKGMIVLRQRAHAERAVAHPSVNHDVVDEMHVERIREFHDRNGCQWRAWAVVPGQASSTSTRNLGDLRDGWLAFESMSDSGKRRLAKYPDNWTTLSDGELELLLESAADAPVRKRAHAPDTPPPD